MGGICFSVEEAAPLLGVKPSTIRKWVQRGKLSPVAKRGRADLFDWDDLTEATLDTRKLGYLQMSEKCHRILSSVA